MKTKNPIKKENHSITRIYKSEKSVSEIDMDLYDEILGKDWSEHHERFSEIRLGDNKKYGWQGESHPINIDVVIKLLNGLKAKGCTHAEIMYHCDHIGYYFYGLDVHRSTSEEMDAEEARIEKENKKAKTQRIKELTTELNKLTKS